MLEVAEALALTLPEILKSSVLKVRGEVLLVLLNKLKSTSETPAAAPRDALRDPKKSRSRSTRRRPVPEMFPLKMDPDGQVLVQF